AFDVPLEQRTTAQRDVVARYYRGVSPLLDVVRKQLADLQKQRDELEKAMPTTLVSMTVPPRTMRVLPRGNWLDDSGEVVTPGVPAALSSFPVVDRRATRLDLAEWLIASENP